MQRWSKSLIVMVWEGYQRPFVSQTGTKWWACRNFQSVQFYSVLREVSYQGSDLWKFLRFADHSHRERHLGCLMRWRKGLSPLLILALFIMQWDSGGGRGTCPGLVSTELLRHCGSRAFSGNEAQPCRLQQILSGTCKEDKGSVACKSRREVKQCNAAKEKLFWVMHAFKSQDFKGIKSCLFSKFWMFWNLW